MRRWPIRVHLAVLHGALFLGLGVCLLGATFLMTRDALTPRIERAVSDARGGTATVAPAPGKAGDAHILDRLEAITVDTLLTRSGLALAAAAVLVGFVSWWIAGRSLRPIRRITTVAQGLSDRTLHERIDLGGPRDELRSLADTIDGMLGRLDSAFDAQRRFVANASHELRTPMAIARSAVDVYRAKRSVSAQDADAALSKVDDAIRRSERLLEALLTLARAEVIEGPEEVDLAVIAALVIEERGRGAVRSSLERTPVRGDAAMLERMLANLIDNAVRHGDGDVTVVLTRATRGVRLTVENGGVIIDADALGDLFTPFVRLQGGRIADGSGAGLGLSIVERIVDVHGGSIEAHPREMGGLRVAVYLPSRPNGDDESHEASHAAE